MGVGTNDITEPYLSVKYPSFKAVKDIYLAFIERSFTELKSAGRLGYIVPSAWIGGPQYYALRAALLKKRLDTLILLPYDVFKDAYVDTLILIASNESGSNSETKTFTFPKKERLSAIELTDSWSYVKQSLWEDSADL